MRDPKRIKRILELIERYWDKNPDMRLTQVLVNNHIIPNFPGHWYYLEDDKVEDALSELQEKKKEVVKR